MSGFEIAGVVGLVAGAKGAVDTFNLLADFLSPDTGIGRAAFNYNLESVHFKLWCDNVKVYDQSNCLLNNLAPEIQACVANIIAEIVETQQTVHKQFTDKYNLLPLPDLPPDATFDPNSLFIAQLRSQCSEVKMKRRHRWSWVTGEKQELERLVNELGKMNLKLDRFVLQTKPDETNLVRAAMAKLTKYPHLLSLPNSEASKHPLLAATCEISRIQEQDPTAVAQVKHIESRELKVYDCSKAMDGRYIGIYTAPGALHADKVVVEWKGIKAGTPREQDIVARIERLGACLSTRSEKPFHRMEFVGIMDDKEFERRSCGNRRIGLVYRSPKSFGNLELPSSLAQLIGQRGKDSTRPPLGDRFQLAHKLASAMSLFHSANWLHKSFRSDNILFGDDKDINQPYISGFGYSRTAAEDSMETRPVGDPTLDFYYHPDVMKGWTKIKDIYSLGIVLLEVAFWRPMFEKRFKGMDLRQMAEDIMASLNKNFGKDLEGMVGKVYVDVIKCCLSGSFGVQTGDTPEEAEKLSTAFSLLVLQPLASCKA